MMMTVQRSAHVQDRFLFDVKKHVDIFDVVMTAGLREVVNNAWKARKSANEGVSLMCTIPRKCRKRLRCSISAIWSANAGLGVNVCLAIV